MSKAPKYERVVAYTLITFLRPFNMRWATATYIFFLRRWGTRFTGRPAYISGKVDIDGTDYSLVSLGEGVTLSGNARILTHDWSPYTVGKAMGIQTTNPLGRILPVTIGDYSFIGTGSIVMPGASIGRGCIIGAGSVVRGSIPDFSIVIGNPGQIIGDTRDYLAKKFPEHVALIAQSRDEKD
ncbi:transferase family hexapeptide repeat protein [Nitrosomonas nitrosa]|uniref:acyltransferase n=1 Tax=Nitrosomonas nitrosa TaxID=52442 RepID=UPI000D325044|nr:acyltransferase [Nitrosomonas nitrosa]PTR02783.1 transferase family hexapeptide repeat protein [Nitrosomonas nitrosa]